MNENNQPPKGCLYVLVLLTFALIFCAGYGFYKIFELITQYAFT